MINLNYLMDHVLYQNYFEYKKHNEKFDNPPIRIYGNKIEYIELHLKLKQGIVLNF